MKFSDLPASDVSDWLGSPTTAAFLEFIQDRIRVSRDEAIDYSRKGEHQQATVRVGRLDAYNDVITTIKAKARE